MQGVSVRVGLRPRCVPGRSVSVKLHTEVTATNSHAALQNLLYGSIIRLCSLHHYFCIPQNAVCSAIINFMKFNYAYLESGNIREYQEACVRLTLHVHVFHAL